jgi:hypothetical protein
VGPAAYHRDAAGQIVEKRIGEQGLLEMRRQVRMLGVKDIELDVYSEQSADAPFSGSFDRHAALTLHQTRAAIWTAI